VKLPKALLGTLLAAVAGASLAGCYERDCASSQSPPDGSVGTSSSGTDTDCGTCPAPCENGQQRDSCPACGQG
jgi:hypothetical protein